MNTKFLIQTDIAQEDLKDITQALDLLKYEYKLIKHTPTLENKDLETIFSADDCVVFYGNIALAKKIIKYCPWIPGIYFTEKNFYCTEYYSNYSKFLLNKDYIILPVGELIRQKDFVFKIFNSNKVFIRPNTGIKIFGGDVFPKESFDYKIKDLIKYHQLLNSDLVLIACAKNILQEYRFVVSGVDVISGSRYIQNDEISISSEIEQSVLEFAKQVCKEVKNPVDKIYTLDIAKYLVENKEEYAVVEVNSFSCSGLYASDKVKVFKCASEIALKEWEEYNE